MRRLARELEVDLAKVKGTGEKGRITKDDVKAFLRGPQPRRRGRRCRRHRRRHGHPGDPGRRTSAKFGPIETKPLARIKQHLRPVPAPRLAQLPHVTHGDEADVTELEAYRKQLDDAAKADKKSPYRVSLLPFLMKASVSALRAVPRVQQLAQPGEGQPDPTRSTTISASRSTRRKVWSSRWSRMSTARASSS